MPAGLPRLRLMDWQDHAQQLATVVTHPGSRWYGVVAALPRHSFVPAWWERDGDGWIRRQGPLAEVYTNRSLVTRVGELHADSAGIGDRPAGRSTSSSTLPSLLLTMYRHAQIADGLDVLDVGTGSGYGTALLATRYGSGRVTAVDVDPYLTAAATERLAGIGLDPQVLPVDATDGLPGTYDRIVSTMSVPSIPPSWLRALRPGGRIVTTIAGTWMILAVDRTRDGFAGRVARDWAGFMAARSGADYPPDDQAYHQRWSQEGDSVGVGRYPVLDIGDAWDLATTLTLAIPGIRTDYRREPAGGHTALLTHPDGSWARATAVDTEPPTVHQGGRRPLWDLLDDARDEWMRVGMSPWLGAQAIVRADGSIRLIRGDWRATIPAAG
ncbi:methyltransferase domain-containing protein [Frankia sp. AgB32]|uniref:methyltransferase domain-containing protein n=1 Tax=Frankia sp. AgB32 TaxID=631119 RepID=UPI00200FA446|nr:methyltransferase domain-containing protein [Frankia sp. AgB32]MCK9898285.1 methyltransferase domain-containing protein [Frankia sp. AgB32]